MTEGEENDTVRSGMGRLALVALVVAILAAAYVWVNGVPGATQEVPDSDARAQGAAPRQASGGAPAPEPGQKKVVLEDLGMVCPLCQAAVEAALERTPGVVAYDVDLKTDSATVTYDPARVTIEDLKRAVAEAGYQVRGVREVRE